MNTIARVARRLQDLCSSSGNALVSLPWKSTANLVFGLAGIGFFGLLFGGRLGNLPLFSFEGMSQFLFVLIVYFFATAFAATIIWFILRLTGKILLALGDWHIAWLYNPSVKLEINIKEKDILLTLTKPESVGPLKMGLVFQKLVVLDKSPKRLVLESTLHGVAPAKHRMIMPISNMNSGPFTREVIIGRNQEGKLWLILGHEQHRKEYLVSASGSYYYCIRGFGEYRDEKFQVDWKKLIFVGRDGRVTLQN